MPLWLSILLVLIVPTALSMWGTSVVRSRFGVERLQTNNEVASFKFAAVGVLYAVLLAFAVIVVWESFSSAEDQVAKEAGAAATLYRLAGGMEPATRAVVVQKLNAYLESAVNDDWPAMENGTASPQTTRALDELYAAVLAGNGTDVRAAMLMHDTLQELNVLTEARRARIVKSIGIVPPLLWAVLVAGAIITVGFTYFFGTENLPAQRLMTGALAFLIFSGLLVIVAIDKPFRGPIMVHPEAILNVLEQLGHPPVPAAPR